MPSEDNNITVLQTRVRQLILKFKELKAENDELYAELDKKEQEIAELNRNQDSLKKDYESLKLARMMAISDQDVEDTKARLAKLIREVNKCIALLKGES